VRPDEPSFSGVLFDGKLLAYTKGPVSFHLVFQGKRIYKVYPSSKKCAKGAFKGFKLELEIVYMFNEIETA